MKRNFNEDNSNKKNKKKVISKAPRNVDIVQFAEARSFELNAIESALKNATENTGNQRVFQSLPRHLRRRAASHNIKRIPLQFRKKAYWERKNDPNPKLPPQKPKNRKDKRKPGTIIEEYNRRSANVKWLETHVWHSKRMKMCEKWGYKLAEYPREKGRKIIYKDEKYTCLLHDASYYQCIEINGTVNDIKNVFNPIIDLSISSITSNRYIKGNKLGNSKIYEFKKYPFNTIAPITFLWKAIKNNEVDYKRTLWLWVHPSSCQDIINEIENSKNFLKISDVKVDLMKDEIIMFQLAGPRSHAILQETLNLCNINTENIKINEDAHKIWENLKFLRTPSSLPAGVVLGLTVHDPRLSNFKKMEKRISEISEKDQNEINKICNKWPDNVAFSSIWDGELRKSLNNNKCTEDSLNKRRNESLIPGTPLEPLENDSKIPILLAQRGATNYIISNDKQSKELLYGWNLYIPKGWAMAFFKPLVFAGARVIGLNNIYELYFESSISCYPYDYIETKSYKNYIDQKAKKEEEIYNRKPISKRPNYLKLGIMSPFKPPFEAYLSMIKQQSQIDDSLSLWVLNTPKLINLIIEEAKIESKSIEDLNDKLYSEIKNQYDSHNIDISIDEIKRNNSIINGFIRVSIDILGKGVINDNSIIYLSTKNEYNKWLNSKKKNKEDNSSIYNIGEFPPSTSIIGFVTTGHYSLNNAHAKAIGCCSIVGLKEMYQNNINNNYNHSTFVLVRDPKGQVIRPAILNFIS
ncbi:POP1-domain-containing protein [Neocallimastix californiae]|uniref:POP1-domain-containing protein n=1 Tax=Neocallimastix californiae TaxID=1754190 RepID=A0A1Y2BCZ0_9FUNG|nr:POP1-domain-containing protein [Neocallimastix californiae]|eukprot:ORY32347.1 POP1-domain-containing protein [Neocallimastix californiae]